MTVKKDEEWRGKKKLNTTKVNNSKKEREKLMQR